MTYAVGHALTACSYDRKGLDAFWRAHHYGSEVGVEIALSLIESELRMAWLARTRPHPSVWSEESRTRRAYRVACIRGLIAAALAVGTKVKHRRVALPVTWGRS